MLSVERHEVKGMRLKGTGAGSGQTGQGPLSSNSEVLTGEQGRVLLVPCCLFSSMEAVCKDRMETEMEKLLG